VSAPSRFVWRRESSPRGASGIDGPASGWRPGKLAPPGQQMVCGRRANSERASGPSARPSARLAQVRAQTRPAQPRLKSGGGGGGANLIESPLSFASICGPKFNLAAERARSGRRRQRPLAVGGRAGLPRAAAAAVRSFGAALLAERRASSHRRPQECQVGATGNRELRWAD